MRWALGLLLISRLAVAGADSTFMAGQNALDSGDLATAASQFEAFVHSFPNDARLGDAAIMWLQALHGVDEPRRLGVIEELYVMPGITGVDRDRIMRLHDSVIAQRIRELSATGVATNLLKAAQLSETLIADADSAQAKFQLTYSAFAKYERARGVKDMQRMLRAAIALEPNHHLVQPMRMRMAELEQATDPEDAATNYLEAGKWCHDCADYSEARLTAAALFLALGEPNKAYDAATSYLADFPDNIAYGEKAALLVVDAAAKISDALAEHADTMYLRRAHPAKAAEIWLRLALVARNRTVSEHAIAKTIALTELDPSKSAIYGQALFARAEWLARDANVALAVPSTKIAATLEQRTRLVEAALTAYENVAGSKDAAWTIAALDRAAHVYEDHVTAIESATPLATENVAEKMAYRGVVASYAVNNVSDGYRAAYELALASNDHGTYAIDAFHHLEKPLPARELRNGEPLEPLIQDARLDARR
jgi:hypothetical protein